MRITKYLILLVPFLLICLSSSALAWGPATHTWITQELLENPEGNEILQLCNTDEECYNAFMAGSMIPDITVVYYFEHGGRNYRATHNWNFQQEVMNQATTDNEKAFAYGIAQHLISDSVAHQEVVPRTIEETGIPNWLVHPLVEQKYDSLMKSKYPYLDEDSRHMFDAIIYGPHGDRYIEMVEQALGDNINLDVEDHIIKLATSFDSYYDSDNGSFKPTGFTIFSIYPFVSTICDMAEPLTSITGASSMDAARLRTLEENRNVYNNWGARHSLVPHGFDSLNDAEQEASTGGFSIAFGIYLLAIFIVPLGVLYYLKSPFYSIASLFAMILGLLGWIVYIYLTI